MEKPKMQEAAKIQQGIDHAVQHQEAKAEIVQEQLSNVMVNKDRAERELAKFRVLKEGFKVAAGVLNQQFAGLKQQESPNPVTVAAFEGAIGHLGDLASQADMAIAKNEGSFMAFQAMAQQLEQQMAQAQARGKIVATQGAKAVELAERGQAAGEIVAQTAQEPAEAPIKSVADLIAGADEADEEPIEAPKKKATSKKGRGRRKK